MQLAAHTSRTSALVSTMLAPTVSKPAPAPTPQPIKATGVKAMFWLNVDQLKVDVPGKISKAFAASVAQHGVLTPLLVEAAATTKFGARYNVIAGRRRLAAAIAAKLPIIPCMVVDALDVGNVEALTIIENLHRSRDLASELRAMRALAKQGLDDDQLQARLGLLKRDFSKFKKLSSLGQDWIDVLEAGRMSPTTAAIVAGLPKAEQQKLFATLEGDQRVTLDAVRSFRLKSQYAAKQLSFLALPIPTIEAKSWA